MNQKFLITAALVFFGLGILLITQTQNSGKLRMIFCDVGQGDGMLLISPGGKQVVVDGGPGSKILECLSSNMPFSDRSIDMIIATHAQKDHMEGLLSVLERYEVATVVDPTLATEASLYKEWSKLVTAEGAKVIKGKSGDKFVVDKNVVLNVLWPSLSSILGWSTNAPKDLNDSSYVMRLDYGPSSCAYLTGDIPKEILETVIDRPCAILKVSHHGSKTGTNAQVIEKAKPKVAVIQVGKNSYGHPTREVLDLLVGVNVLRNDLLGTIEIDSDGKGELRIMN
ncbi:MAG: hypothetical protein U1C56_00190 [Candidatus Curtissbacteria bacterium]|nr:hypothetical protein [Candidatus Curtissbacteria bacterium]